MTVLLPLALWTKASKYGIFAALTRRSWSCMGMGKHYSLKKPMCTSFDATAAWQSETMLLPFMHIEAVVLLF